MQLYSERKDTTSTSEPKEVVLSRARLFEAVERYSEALDLYLELYRQYPTNTVIALSLARCYQAMNEYNKALMYFIELVQKYPQHKMFQIGLVRCYQDMHQHDYVMEGYAQLRQRFPDDKQVLLSLAGYFEQIGNFLEAKGLFEQLVDQYPHAVPAWLGVVRCSQLLSPVKDTIALYERLHLRFPKDKSILLSHARYLETQGDQRGSERRYQQLIHAFPFFIEAHYSYGVFLEKFYHHREAIEIYKDLLKRFPNYKPTAISLAFCYQKLGLAQEAKSCLESSIERFPACGPFYSAYLLLLLTSNQRSEAHLFYQEAKSRLAEQTLREMKELLFLSEPSTATAEELFSLPELTTGFVEPRLTKLKNNCDQIELPLSISKVLLDIERGGYIAFLIGGAVRDLILGFPINDVDIFTDAPKAFILEQFHGSHVATFIPELCVLDWEGQHYEFSLGRKNELNRRMKMRDFTVNTLYCDSRGTIHDPLKKGLLDLQRYTLNAIGDPVEGFQEDPLRILRASRFCMRYGLKLPVSVREAMKKCAPLLKDIVPGRLHSELSKQFLRGEANKNFDHLLNLGLFEIVFPKINEAFQEQPSLKSWMYQELEKTDFLVRHAMPVTLDYIYALFISVVVRASSRDAFPSDLAIEKALEETLKQTLHAHQLQHIKRLTQLCLFKLNKLLTDQNNSFFESENSSTFSECNTLWQNANGGEITHELRANSESSQKQATAPRVEVDSNYWWNLGSSV